MGISNDLLEKYASGTCNAEERVLVEQWLNSSDTPQLLLSEKDKEVSKEKIWNMLDAGIRWGNVKKLRYYLSLAAAIIAVSGLTVLWQQHNQPVNQLAGTYMELGGQNKVTELAGMRFTLASDSEAKVRFTEGAASDIVFCGVMEVKNVSDKDVSYIFKSICKNSSYTKKEVVMKAGKTYVVLHNYYKRDEILVLNKENLVGLPDAVTAKISTQLTI